MSINKIRKCFPWARRANVDIYQAHPEEGDGLVIFVRGTQAASETLNTLPHPLLCNITTVLADVDPRQAKMIGVSELITRKLATFKLCDEYVIFKTCTATNRRHLLLPF